MHLDLKHEHPWDVPPSRASEIQRELAQYVREAPLPVPPRTIAGLDVSVKDDRVQAAIVVLKLPTLEVVDEATWRGPVAFPYVPGLLSFREIPAILPALEMLSVRPDVYMLDAQGRAHPRRFGLACHLGVLLDAPAFGVAKSLLVGHFEEPDPIKESTSPLFQKDEVIGRVVRTRDSVQPVYVSVGHKITLDEAVALTLACTTRYKIPEPTRLAHHLSQKLEA